MVCPHNRILYSNENEQSTTTCNSVDEAHIHIEQDAREFIPYDPIYKKIQKKKRGKTDLSGLKSGEWLFLGQIVTRGDSQIKFKKKTNKKGSNICNVYEEKLIQAHEALQ